MFADGGLLNLTVIGDEREEGLGTDGDDAKDDDIGDDPEVE